MNPLENSINLPKKQTDKLLKYLYNRYAKHNSNVSNLKQHPFFTINLMQCETFKSFLPDVVSLSTEFSNYCVSSMSSVTMNSLVKGNTLSYDTGKYYLTEEGYKQGLKASNIFSYWSKYHSMAYYPTLCIVVTTVLATVIGALLA